MVGNKLIYTKPPAWASDAPLTRGQLLSMRDDFWDTSPSYGGKPEIWQVTPAFQHSAHPLSIGPPPSSFRSAAPHAPRRRRRRRQALRVAAETEDVATAQAIMDAVNVTCAPRMAHASRAVFPARLSSCY